MKKLFVNACCGPCACHVEPFKEYDVALHFNGDNFDSKEEYDRRLEALELTHPVTRLVVDAYNYKLFESCEECIAYRLGKAAVVARESGFDMFTTTLTVSPHKNTELVNRIGREIGSRIGVEFLELDLKKGGGFEKSVRRSQELGIYRQRYCGCKNSMRE